jgi:Papain family cysteine protease
MKHSTKSLLVYLTFITLVISGCSKSPLGTNGSDLQDPNNLVSSGRHIYGVLPMTPDQYLNIPLYSKDAFRSAMGLKGAAVAPAVYTLSSPPVRDQGQIGSCTAFCGAEVDEILYFYKNSGWPPVLSPAFIYYCERVLLMKQKITSDPGANMVNIPQALQKYGACLESSYAYPSSTKSTAYKTAPTAANLTEGLTYRIGQATINYAMITSGDTAAVKTVLRSNVPVMLGFNVYDVAAYTIFENLNTTNYTYNPLKADGTLVTGAKLLGGHAVPIIGYDDTKKAFLVQNSWGTAWGNHGFFYLPYSVFMSSRIVPTANVYYATLQ